MMRITRRYCFAASHRLHSVHLTEEQNRELYGKCNNPYGHGHDYTLEVTVAGPRDPVSGLVAPIAPLDKLVSEQVLRDFDHRYLNLDVREFAELVPTSENIIRVIEDRLRAGWEVTFPGRGPRLEAIRLQETKRNRFELNEAESKR